MNRKGREIKRDKRDKRDKEWKEKKNSGRCGNAFYTGTFGVVGEGISVDVFYKLGSCICP